MNDLSPQGRPAKRPRESSCPPPGLGYRDNHEIPKNPDPRKHQEPKPMGPPARVDTSTTERFRPLARELIMLDERNPFLADHAADLVMIFRRVWDSYTAGHTENSRLEKDNHRLQAENARLLKGQSEMEGRCRDSGQPPRHFIEAIQKLQDGLKTIFEQWEKAINTDPSKQADTKEVGAVAGVGPSAP